MSFWVVPCRPSARRALFVGDRDVERHQPRRGGVDRHRGVHRGERDAVEQRPHVADMGDRDADLADLAARERVVAVVAGLGRQIEGDREAGLALGEIGAIEAVRLARRRMAGVGAENPRLVARRDDPGCRRPLGVARRPLFDLFGSCAEHNRRKWRRALAARRRDCRKPKPGVDRRGRRASKDPGP